MGRRDHYHVYVVELSKDVLLESKFNKRNPGYITAKPCVYVGMTGLDLDVASIITRQVSSPTGTRSNMDCGCYQTSMKGSTL